MEPEGELFDKAIALAHHLVSCRLVPGDLAADATAGNGHDTLMLARQVGPQGRIYAFDVQPEALNRTRELLNNESMAERVTLISDGHEHMSGHVKDRLAAVMFNLGYLPGGDRSIITTAGTTLAGIREALLLLKPGGLVTIIAYTGHRGAEEEKKAVIDYCRQLDQRKYTVMHVNYINQIHYPPELLAIQFRP